MRLLLVIILFFNSFSHKSIAQESQLEAASFNVVGGLIIGGIGAIINKKSEDKVLNTFLNGASQGALGGLVVYSSKRLLGSFATTSDYGYIWPSRILNSAGSSMIYNGAANREFGRTWFINIGFNHIYFDKKAEKKIKFRILPIALAGTIDGINNGKLSIEKTFKTGVFIFEREELIPNSLFAYNIANSVVIWTDVSKESFTSSLAHEIIHAFHYDNFFGLNAILTPIESNLIGETKFHKIWSKIFLSEYNYLPIGVNHLLSREWGDSFERTWFEKEPTFFDNRSN